MTISFNPTRLPIATHPPSVSANAVKENKTAGTAAGTNPMSQLPNYRTCVAFGITKPVKKESAEKEIDQFREALLFDHDKEAAAKVIDGLPKTKQESFLLDENEDGYSTCATAICLNEEEKLALNIIEMAKNQKNKDVQSEFLLASDTDRRTKFDAAVEKNMPEAAYKLVKLAEKQDKEHQETFLADGPNKFRNALRANMPNVACAIVTMYEKQDAKTQKSFTHSMNENHKFPDEEADEHELSYLAQKIRKMERNLPVK